MPPKLPVKGGGGGRGYIDMKIKIDFSIVHMLTGLYKEAISRSSL